MRGSQWINASVASINGGSFQRKKKRKKKLAPPHAWKQCRQQCSHEQPRCGRKEGLRSPKQRQVQPFMAAGRAGVPP
eukprot:3819274-Rhodomonas_salina.4